MDVLMVLTAATIAAAAGCQTAHYVIDGRPWLHAFFPPTLHEWIIPKCPVCWQARGMVAACLVAIFVV